MAPTLDQIVTAALEADRRDLWTCSIGKVVSYDSTARTAEVEPQIKREVPNEDGEPTYEVIPALTSVPVFFLSAGPFSLTFPIEPGTPGLLIFATHDFAAWYLSGKISNPGDLGLHHLSSAIFVPGLVPSSTPMPQAEEDAVVLRGDDIRFGRETANDPPITKSALDAKWLELTSWVLTGAAPSGGGTVTYADPPPDAPEGAQYVKMVPP